MMRCGWLLAATACMLACSNTVQTSARSVASESKQTPNVEYCAAIRLSDTGPLCVVKLTPEQQRHRMLSIRVEYAGERIVTRTRINGRGYGVPDSDGCVSYAYRYEAGKVVESVGRNEVGTVCDRTLYTENQRRLSFVDEW